MNVRVAPSRLGKGVYAKKPFKKNEVIGDVVGQIIIDPAYDSSYCIELEEGRTLEPKAPFRFLNHSCDPNCLLAGEGDSVWVEALRQIEVGQQLTIDYAWPADSAIPCLCGSVKCRGWIVDKNELRLLKKGERK